MKIIYAGDSLALKGFTDENWDKADQRMVLVGGARIFLS